MGQRLRRRSRDADRRPAWPSCGSIGCAPSSTSTRASSARTRWSLRSTTASTAAAAQRRRSTRRCTGSSDAAHVDHLHPDAGIALATGGRRRGADPPLLRRSGGVGRWRRPGFQLGLDMAEVQRTQPEAIGAILGGHGITAWGETSRECEARSLEIIETALSLHRRAGSAEPFGGPGLPRPLRVRRTPARRPRCCPVRGLASTDRPRSATTRTATSSSTSSVARSIPVSRPSVRRARITSCGPRSGRWCWTCRRRRRSRMSSPAWRELHESYRVDYARLLRAPCHPRQARRCAGPIRPSC